MGGRSRSEHQLRITKSTQVPARRDWPIWRSEASICAGGHFVRRRNGGALRDHLGPMVQNHELSRAQGKRSVSPSVVIAKLDFVGAAVKRFNDRADLPLNQSALR